MDEIPSQPPAASPRKKIRLTKSEVYAMGISSPKKKRIAFGLVGLLILAATGNLLWYFQDVWLPYWFPAEPAPVPIQAVADEKPAAPAAPARPAGEAPAPVPIPAPATLDFLSATAWDHPQFIQGVRLFNQALDRFRTFQRDRRPAELLKQVEGGALQAAMAFDQIRAEAPAAVPLAEYVARCQKLAVEARNLARPPSALAPAPAPKPAVAAPPPRPATPPPKPGETWQDPDFLEGAKLFNQALEQYKLFLADKSHVELLKPIEDTAFQAAKKFEAIQNSAPSTVPIGDHVSKCYRLIADCRRQNLESANPESADSAPHGKVVGPSRRPALPAYQPPP